MSFGKKPPLTVKDKLNLLTLKNEMDQNILVTLACCRNFWDEESVASICIEFQRDTPKPVVPKKDPKKKNDEEEVPEPKEINIRETILERRIDLALQYATLFSNAKFIKLVRNELVSNPMQVISEEKYAKLCF
jgi:hypothetical protein